MRTAQLSCVVSIPSPELPLHHTQHMGGPTLRVVIRCGGSGANRADRGNHQCCPGRLPEEVGPEQGGCEIGTAPDSMIQEALGGGGD